MIQLNQFQGCSDYLKVVPEGLFMLFYSFINQTITIIFYTRLSVRLSLFQVRVFLESYIIKNVTDYTMKSSLNYFNRFFFNTSILKTHLIKSNLFFVLNLTFLC